MRERTIRNGPVPAGQGGTLPPVRPVTFGRSSTDRHHPVRPGNESSSRGRGFEFHGLPMAGEGKPSDLPGSAPTGSRSASYLDRETAHWATQQVALPRGAREPAAREASAGPAGVACRCF